MDIDVLEFVDKIASIESAGDTLDRLPQLISLACEKGQETQVYERLNELASKSAIRVEQLSAENNQDFSKSVNQLSVVRSELRSLQSLMADLNTDIQASGRDLQNMKQQLNSLSTSERFLTKYHNLVRSCMQVLHQVQYSQELLSKKQYLPTLRICSEISEVHLKRLDGLGMYSTIQQYIVTTKEAICSAVMEDLHEWLFSIRQKLPLVGKSCSQQIDEARRRWAREYKEDLVNLSSKTSISLELYLLEMMDFSPLDNEIVKISFEPLYICLQVHSYLGLLSSFRSSFERDRRRQQEFLAPKSLTTLDMAVVSEWLNSIAGFMIVEYYILQCIPNFRSYEEVQNIWTIICEKLVETILSVAFTEQSTTTIIKLKNQIVLLMHTMERFGFSVESLRNLCVELIDAFGGALILKHSVFFEEAFEKDVYAPMIVETQEEYDHYIAPYWNFPSEPFPRTMSFSKMCPLCCTTLSKFVRHFFMFLNDSVILATEVNEKAPRFYRRFILRSLVDRLKSLYPKLALSQMSQLVKNFYAFEDPLLQIEKSLVLNKPIHQIGAEASSSNNVKSTELLEGLANARKSALHEIFVKINLKIDDFLGLAEYDWTTTQVRKDVSGYLQEMVTYLQTMYLESLAGLPKHDKSYVYLETLDHLCTAMVDLLSDPSIRKVTTAAAEGFKLDVEYLESFAAQVPDQSIVNADSFIELRQCANLLLGDNMEEYLDTDKFMRDFNRLQPAVAIKFLERHINNYSANPLSNDRPKRRAIEILIATLKKR
ncbi:Exocyst complex component sec15 [Schizosaccharomyces pombe]|uniref:Exocyst complex component sec15 n=1 Tax=Schizosaccharomyces pombe (strain 972 / ATCC 24843) TaxID=284812 RepID=SEC15_SCHPO|nr:putative exocyst complex subunit Sec15 [Schizosaccharomyces pombe]O75006.2 RecName: Full=Exocyst complex component sec15 [Schizosaccharomyces pombe 972h-]CAA20451.2 exocyst complex subunit Sec15 (predicted) [Schizosaccharomyces pombe]|eukprot:NP_587884.2 putative exocyst complex subunit Sec15 [Schizosaccharomyces pombe]